MTHKVYQLCHL